MVNRGRPKYSDEDRIIKRKEAVKRYKDKVKERTKLYNKEYYEINKIKIIKANCEYKKSHKKIKVVCECCNK